MFEPFCFKRTLILNALNLHYSTYRGPVADIIEFHVAYALALNDSAQRRAVAAFARDADQ